MRQIHTFDEVFDSQKMFRIILEAMANPGRVLCVEEFQNKLFGEQPGLLAVAMTLLDASVSFHAFENSQLSEQILLLTHARPQSAAQGDFLFAASEKEMEAAILQAKCGTLEDPHKSATLVVLLEEEQPCRALQLRGPGVDGTIEIQVPETVVRAIRLREDQRYEYPTGIDFIFLNHRGELWCLPRLVKGEVV